MTPKFRYIRNAYDGLKILFFLMIIVFQYHLYFNHLYCIQGSFTLKRYPSVTLECTCMILEVSLNKYEDLLAVVGLLAVSPHIQKLVLILKVQLTQIT